MQEDVRAIKADEMEECLDLWEKVFEGVGRSYFEPYFHGDPWFKPDYTRVCLVDGRIVSAVQICERKVRVGSAEILMGGIGNVATDPDYRGRGYSTRLLEDAVLVMREYGMDLSILFTGIQPYYERLDWRSAPTKLLTGSLRRDVSVGPKSRCSVRTLDPTSDMASIHQVYEKFNNDRSLTVVRTPEYWKGYLLPHLRKPESILVAEENGVVGYLLFEFDKDNCWLRETGCVPGKEDCTEALIRCAASRACEAGVQTIWSYLPNEPQISAVIGMVVKCLEERESTKMMCRLINADSLGRRILPELNRRAQMDMLPDGSISLDTELGSLGLTLEKGRVSQGAGNPVRIIISQADLFCLLFGLKGINELSAAVPDEAARIVSALFPPQRPVFWQADGF